MLYDKETNRFILESGKFVLSDDAYCLKILNGEAVENVLVSDSDDARKYQMITNERIVLLDSDDEFDLDHQSLDDGALDLINERIYNSPRLQGTEQEELRIQNEMDYFHRSETLILLKKLIELVDRFKSDGVVWGVGRGSSCASYVLYLLEIHDIDPLKYDIPFTEMSKE
jgi:DNA polymerase III alpha subunit